LALALVGDHVRDLALHAEHLELPVHERRHLPHARLGVERLQDRLLVGDRRLLGREIRRDEIGERARLADVVQDAGGLARQVRHEAE